MPAHGWTTITASSATTSPDKDPWRIVAATSPARTCHASRRGRPERVHVAEYPTKGPNVLLGFQADFVFAILLLPEAADRTREEVQIYLIFATLRRPRVTPMALAGRRP